MSGAMVDTFHDVAGDAWAEVRYTNGVQTFGMTVPADDADTVARLLPLCAYGPNYRRGVADALDTYYRLTRRDGVGDADSAAYWLDQATGCAVTA